MGYIGNAPYQGVLTGANIQDGTVDTADIANDAVTTVKMADVSVTAGKLHTTLDLSAKTVTLPDGSVTNAKLASGIDASKLTAGTLPIARIADASITAAKLAAGAAVPVQTGNSGKFLTTDGTNASWGAVDLASRVDKTGDTMTGTLNLPTVNATTQVNVNGSLLANSTRIALPIASSDPSTPATGQMYWSTGSSKIKVYNGSAWRTVANADVDPYWSQVSLYLRGGSLTDLKGIHSVSSVNASLATQPGKPFAGADSNSWYQLNTSSTTGVYLDIGTNLDDFDPSQNTALTIEFWLWKPAGYASYGHFYNIGGQGGQGVMKFAGDSSYGLYWFSSNGEGINWGGSGSFGTGTWTHFVYEKNGSTQTSWKNGVRINQNTNALPSGSPTFMRLGYLFNAEYCPHYFDELRVTKAARYQGAATIPVQSAPYPTE